MKFKHTKVFNFEGAFRGLRNPLESWDKSDSCFGLDDCDSYVDFDVADNYCFEEGFDKKEFIESLDYATYADKQEEYAEWLRKNGILDWDYDVQHYIYAYLGPKDIDLAHRMIKAGSADRKFLRQIMVSVDITAPLYFWKEFDTYKIGTVANSTSTMHKLASTPITRECFEMEDFSKCLVIDDKLDEDEDGIYSYSSDDFVTDLINRLEKLRIKYKETGNKKYWKELIRWLPESWLQTRTVTLNYEVLRNIFFQRQYHRLTEWHKFCDWIKDLPYANDLIIYTGKEEEEEENI